MKKGNVIKAAYDALRSYQYGNASPELAEGIADALEEEFSDIAINYENIEQYTAERILDNMRDKGFRLHFETCLLTEEGKKIHE